MILRPYQWMLPSLHTLHHCIHNLEDEPAFLPCCENKSGGDLYIRAHYLSDLYTVSIYKLYECDCTLWSVGKHAVVLTFNNHSINVAKLIYSRWVVKARTNGSYLATIAPLGQECEEECLHKHRGEQFLCQLAETASLLSFAITVTSRCLSCLELLFCLIQLWLSSAILYSHRQTKEVISVPRESL